MKLYTEQQVNKIALQSKDWGSWDSSITPIEIPDDENIYTEETIKDGGTF